MNCKVEKTEKANEVKLEITIEAEKFDNAMKKVYFQNAKYFNIPGFRKGKAPMNIVEKYYGIGGIEESFDTISIELGVSKERVRQLCKKAVLKLKNYKNLTNK